MLDGGLGGRLVSFFLCPKIAKNGGGVTGGVTKWGYIFRELGLQNKEISVQSGRGGKVLLF